MYLQIYNYDRAKKNTAKCNWVTKDCTSKIKEKKYHTVEPIPNTIEKSKKLI